MRTFFRRPIDVPDTQPDRAALRQAGDAVWGRFVEARATSFAQAWRGVWVDRTAWRRYLGWWVYERLAELNNLLLLPLFTLLGCELALGFEPPESRALYLVISMFFLAEWGLGLTLARRAGPYVLNVWLLADLLSSLPLTAALQSLRLTRVARLMRFVKLMHVFRARRFPFPFAKVFRVGLVALAVAAAGAIGLAASEPDTVGNLGDAMWWAVVTMTTVGYGDISPTTPAGRLVAGVLMVTGVGVFGYLAGLMANGLFDAEEEAMLEQLTRLEAKVDRLLQAQPEGDP